MAKQRAQNTDAADGSEDIAAIARDVDALKRLLMLLLVKLGSTSDEIAIVLDVDPSAVRRLVPSRSIKRIIQSKGAAEG